MTDSEAAARLLSRHRDEMDAACEARDSERIAALAMVPVKVWLEGVMQDHDPVEIRTARVRECLEQVRLGHCNAALREMGYADGCIRAARRVIDAEAGPYGEQDHPMTTGDVIHD